ncbi:MAG: ATP synthase F0 subunit B [Mogibacterium sp.]|nr:ATP synthase F0 subunit B [Mogibacterium sp.]
MPLNIDFQQIFLHMLNFVILFAGLYFILYKPVTDFMQKREETYRSMDDSARNNLAAAERAKTEYEAKLGGVEEEVRKIKEQARTEMYEERSARIKQAEQEASEIIEKAHADAMVEYNKIISDSQRELEAIAYKAARKVLLKPDDSAFDEFLNTAEVFDAVTEAAADMKKQ